MFDRIKKWWAGEFRQTPMETILKGSEFENVIRPWPVRAGRAAGRFYLNHWQWFWGVVITIVLAVFFGAR